MVYRYKDCRPGRPGVGLKYESLNVMFKRELDYYRHKFRYTLCKVYETISYLDSSEITELFDDVKSSGQITDYELRNATITESVSPLPTVGPHSPSGQGTLAPLSSQTYIPITENQLYAPTGWQDNLGLEGPTLKEPDHQPLLNAEDPNFSILGPQSADSPQFLPYAEIATADREIFSEFTSAQSQATDLFSATELNEPITATANSLPLEPALCMLQPDGQGNLSYPTPSSSCDSPETELRELTPAAPASASRNRASKSKSTTKRKRIRRQGNSQDTMAEEAVYSLLKPCVFERKTIKKKDRKKTDVMQEDVVETWIASESRGQHALGIPSKWRGIEAAAEYFTELHSKKITDPVSSWVAELLHFINYHDMCKRPMDFCSRPPKEGEDKIETHVLNCIVEAIPRYFKQDLPLDKRRDMVSNVIRYGRWWWRLSHWLGVSILLLGDDELFQMMKSKMFTNKQIDALITYALRGRLGTVKLFRLSDPVMRALIRGTVSQELKDAVYSSGSRLFTETILECALGEDTALVQENPGVSWTNAVLDDKDPGDSLFAILGISDTSQPKTHCSQLLCDSSA
ncbi:uncharacterized protein BO80DRAFT_431482 [Aspergillus ibericus CBS 121593]|uniref:Uncharacterized protein n=1 Tax=Aspergillus ibericus CBS 121593 TaxID=1448316 RepID=A0A395HAF4_9EURO|nr:hypothetical protein BO80DRAFT_431482 [Aspergillus ibericus CBS 121593]RAL04897.1 hypothetical protein BO80DRAFT_431482 [Aspergillus ibericus CBS 121593]